MDQDQLALFTSLVTYGIQPTVAVSLTAIEGLEFVMQDGAERMAERQMEMLEERWPVFDDAVSNLTRLLTPTTAEVVRHYCNAFNVGVADAYSWIIANTSDQINDMVEIPGFDAAVALASGNGVKLRVLPTGERRDQIAEKMCSSLDRRGNGPEVFVHATLRSRATAIFQDGIQLLNCRPYRDFGMSPSFYLHPVNQLMDAVAWAEIAYKHCAYPGPAPQCAMLFYSLPADWKTHNPNGWELQLGVPADVEATRGCVEVGKTDRVNRPRGPKPIRPGADCKPFSHTSSHRGDARDVHYTDDAARIEATSGNLFQRLSVVHLGVAAASKPSWPS